MTPADLGPMCTQDPATFKNAVGMLVFAMMGLIIITLIPDKPKGRKWW